jgi:hypothetical protein
MASCSQHERRHAAVVSTVAVSTQPQQGPHTRSTADLSCCMEGGAALGPAGRINVHTAALLAELLQLQRAKAAVIV